MSLPFVTFWFSEVTNMTAGSSNELNVVRKKLSEALGKSYGQYTLYLRHGPRNSEQRYFISNSNLTFENISGVSYTYSFDTDPAFYAEYLYQFGSGSRVLMTKTLKKISSWKKAKKFLFKNCNLPSLKKRTPSTSKPKFLNFSFLW